MTARDQLLHEIDQAPESLIEELLDFLLFAKTRRLQNGGQLESDHKQEAGKSILELLEKFPTSEAEAMQLPTDLAAQHDHCLYGSPKRDR